MSLRFARSLGLVGLLFAATAARSQTFDVVPSPNHAPGDSATFNVLRGVGAVGPADAWAVGEWYDPPTQPFQAGTLRTLAMHWDGATWTIVPTPNPAPGGNSLWDIEAIAPDVAWAAGNQGGNGARPLVLRWDGLAWAGHALPQLGTGPFSGTGTLLDMHAVSGDDIWAVGTAGNWAIDEPGDPSFVAIAFHWDGSAWTLTVPPFVTDFRHEISAVHASAPDNVWAVGSWGEAYGRFRPLVYRWDGEQWDVMPAPFDESPFMPLHSVAVLGPDDVWVTADRLAEGSGPVTAHWDGASWTEHANPGGTGALIAVTTDDVFGFGINVTHWDGTAWTVFDDLGGVPGPSLHASELTTNGDMWAVGRQIPGAEIQTLTVRAVELRRPVAGGPVPRAAPYRLSAPAPNPVRDWGQVTLETAEAQDVALVVYDARGRHVAVLHEGALPAGAHTLAFDAAGLPAGVYVVRAFGGGRPVASQRLVVAR